MPGPIRRSAVAIANDVDRTSHNLDVLIQEIRELAVELRRLVDVIERRGITIGAEVAGHPIPVDVTVKPKGE